MQNIEIPGTLLEFITFSTELLKEKNISDARLNIELMLCDVLKCDRMDLYLNFEKPLAKDEIRIFKSFLSRRLKYEPLQYILGKTSFYGLDFIVTNKVLIPRPETELLVEKVLYDIGKSNKEEVSIFEIGAGSGCISIALAKNLQKENIEFDIFSIDRSKDALEVANQNQILNELDDKQIRFYCKNVFEIEKLNKEFDYLVSNPPYISMNEYDKLAQEIKKYEPQNSLTDFDKGLKFFERIFLIATDRIFKGKVFCEIGFEQRDEIELLLKKYKLNDYTFYKDYNGINRILEIIK